MAVETVRIFHVSDSSVLQQGETKQSYLPQYRAAFQARCPDIFPDSRFTQLADCITLGHNTPNDEYMVGHQATLTGNVKTFMSNSKVTYGDIEAAANSAYPDNSLIRLEILGGGRSVVFTNPATLLAYCANFKSIWALHGAALLAVNCPATMPASMLAIEDALIRLKTAQESAMDNRHFVKFDRIANLNTVWTILRDFEIYSERIWGAGSKEEGLFALDHGNSSKKAAPVPKAAPDTE